MPVPTQNTGAGADPFGDPFTGSNILNLRPTAPFVYLASVESGSVRVDGLEEPTWLPELALFRLNPGVQGVEVIREGQPRQAAWAMALEQRRREGWVVLDPSLEVPAEFLPPGESAGPYWREDSVYHQRTGVGGSAFREVWSQRLPSRRPTAPPRYQFFKSGFNRWLAWMVEQDLVPSPDAMAREEVLAQLEAWASSQSRIPDAALRSQRDKVIGDRLELHRSARVIDPAALAASKPPTKRARK